MLALIASCIVSATAATIYAGATGDRWPLLFAATMLVLSLVVALADLLLVDKNDDR